MQDNNIVNIEYNRMFANYPDVVDVPQLQSMLGGIGKQSTYKLLKNSAIKSIKIGKIYRIPKVNVISYLTKIWSFTY